MSNLKVTKTEDKIAIDQDILNLEEQDKLDLLKQEYQVASTACPNYEAEKKEIRGYFIEMLMDPEVRDLSKINKLYAMAQSFSSRVTSLEVNAIDNHSRWKRLVNLMDGYIEDKEYLLLGSEEMAELTNMKAEAAVKTKMAKERKTLRMFQSKLDEAHSFLSMIETKKKDLSSVLTTLGKQVRALALEVELQR